MLGAHIDISAGDVSGDRREHPVARVLERLGVVSLRFEFAADMSEQVKLPPRIEAAGLIDAFESRRSFSGPQGLLRSPFRLVRSRAHPGARARSRNWKRLAGDDDQLRARLLKTVERGFDIGV